MPITPILNDSIIQKLKDIIEKYPATSGECTQCAIEIYNTLTDAEYSAQIGRIETLELFLTTQSILLSCRVGNSLAYHEFVRVSDSIFDALTGPEGMPWHDYQNLFYEGVFEDGTLWVIYVTSQEE